MGLGLTKEDSGLEKDVEKDSSTALMNDIVTNIY